MNVFLVSCGADTGGQSVQIARAMRKYAGWNVQSMVHSDNYIKYPPDLKWDNKRAKKLYDEADVVHHHNRLTAYDLFDGGQKKPALVHHHGSRLRDNPPPIVRESESIGAYNIVSTVDLKLCIESEWLPAPFEIDELAKYGRRRNRDVIRIVHAPTHRGVKGTEVFLNAVNALSKRYLIELDLVENVEWVACLSRKGRADIFFDQLYLGYGNNAIEAWSMNIPVVSGVSDPAVRASMIDEWGELPFYEADETTIVQSLETLIRSRELRDEWAARGHAHVRKYHDAPKVVEQLKDIYTRVAELKMKPARFLQFASSQETERWRRIITPA